MIMSDIIMADPMGAIGQAVQNAGAIDQLSRLRAQDQTGRDDRNMELQDRKNIIRAKSIEYGARAGSVLDSINDPVEKNETYKQMINMGKIQGLDLAHMPPEYNAGAQRYIDLAKSLLVSGKAQSHGTEATYFRKKGTTEIVAAQGNTGGGFFVDGRPINSAEFEPVAAPNTQYAQDQASARLNAQPFIAGQTQQNKSTVDLVMQPQIEAAAERATGLVKTETALKEVARKNAIAFKGYNAGMDNLFSAFGNTATGPIAGRIPALTVGAQSAESARKVMAPVLKQIFREAGEGTFTEGDQKILMDTLPTRDDHPEVVKFKIKMIDDTVSAKLGVSIAERGATPQAGDAAQISAEDQAAIQWAKSNPNDPRAAQILQLHGGR